MQFILIRNIVNLGAQTCRMLKLQGTLWSHSNSYIYCAYAVLGSCPGILLSRSEVNLKTLNFNSHAQVINCLMRPVLIAQIYRDAGRIRTLRSILTAHFRLFVRGHLLFMKIKD